MPIARLSGRVLGRRDPNRRVRARLLYRLYDGGWDIYNGNGDQVVSLSNIQRKIIESDAFVFTPGAKLEDMFKASSIFVGYQTNDHDLKDKTVAILNTDNSWDNFINLIRHLHDRKTVKQLPEDFLDIVYKPKQVLEALEKSYHARLNAPPIPPEGGREHSQHEAVFREGDVERPSRSVCVFCSASIAKEDYLTDGYLLGKELAENNLGCISGAGRTGIMGRVVAGAAENGGWAAGSNVPHIIALEGLPDGLSEFWPRADIYTRMEIMIQESDAFVIMPGGMGTVQELLTLLILKEQGHAMMQDKKIVIFNKQDDDFSERFWAPFIAMINDFGMDDLCHIVDERESILKLVS